MRYTLTSLRTSVLGWLLLPVVAAWLVFVFAWQEWWVGSWPAATAYVTIAATYLGPLLAAGIGYEASRHRLTGAEEYTRLSSGSVMWKYSNHFLFHLLTGYIPMVGVTIVVWGVNVSLAPVGFFRVDHLIYAVCVLTIALGCGYLLGVVISSPLIAALAAAVVGLVVFTVADLPLSGAPFETLSTLHVTIAAVAAIISIGTFVVLSWLVSGYHDRPYRRMAKVSSFGVALSAGAMVAITLMSPTGLVVLKPPQMDPVCTTDQPRVCVWPENEVYLPEVQEMVNRVTTALDGVTEVQEEFAQYGVDRYDIVNSFQLLAPGEGRWFLAGDLASVVVNSAVQPYFCETATPGQQEERTRQIQELLYWLQAHAYGGHQPDEIGGGKLPAPEAEAILEEPIEDQRAWAKAILTDMSQAPCHQSEE